MGLLMWMETPNDGREEFRWLGVRVRQVLSRRKKGAPLLRPNGELGTLILKKESSGREEKNEKGVMTLSSEENRWKMKVSRGVR